MDYRDQVAVVTGASSGLGRRLAGDLAERGAHVIGVARREDRLRELGTDYRVCDLSDVPSYVGVLESIEAEHGRIDILFNIAGIGGTIKGETPTLTSARLVMEVNFFAAYAGTVTVLPGMRKRRHGVVSNMSSDDARAPGPGAGDYAAAKAALSAGTESLAYDARTDNVWLHTIYPAWVPTEMGLAAVRDGGMPMPPRPVRRSEEQVSSLVLRRLGGPRIEINAATLPLIAPMMRTVAPRIYHRMRAQR